MILKVGEQKKALSTVPWGTLILICGVGVLMNIVDQVGGIALLSNGLLSIMGEKTARPILAGTAGLLSLFSLAIAGVTKLRRSSGRRSLRVYSLIGSISAVCSMVTAIMLL